MIKANQSGCQVLSDDNMDNEVKIKPQSIYFQA